VETGQEDDAEDAGRSGRDQEPVESLGEPLETLPEVAPEDGAGASGDGDAGSSSTGKSTGKSPTRSRTVAPLPELFSEPSVRDRRSADSDSEWAD
jgi:hypothetical protein